MKSKYFLTCMVFLVAAGCANAFVKCVSPNGQVVYQDYPCGGARDPKQVGSQRMPELDIAIPNPWTKSPKQAHQMMSIYRRWIDAERLAIASDRAALTGPIAAMQAIQREIEILRVPECLEKPKNNLYELVRKTTNGMLVFMSGVKPGDFDFFLKERSPLVREFERSLRFVMCEGYSAG